MSDKKINDIKEILELAKKGHKGQLRKDGKTPYIEHPLKVCKFLYDYEFVSKKLDEELDTSDFNFYAVALMHDLLEDTNITEKEIIDVSNDYIYHCVDKLTFRKNEDNPFGKFNYIKEIAENNDELIFIIKCVDRICNVYDFMSEGNYKYAKIYFHKADVLWNVFYEKYKDKYPKLWNEILKLAYNKR